MWFLEPYIAYAICIAFISLVSALAGLISTRSNLLKLRKMARYVCSMDVVRGGGEATT